MLQYGIGLAQRRPDARPVSAPGERVLAQVVQHLVGGDVAAQHAAVRR